MAIENVCGFFRQNALPNQSHILIVNTFVRNTSWGTISTSLPCHLGNCIWRSCVPEPTHALSHIHCYCSSPLKCVVALKWAFTASFGRTSTEACAHAVVRGSCTCSGPHEDLVIEVHLGKRSKLILPPSADHILEVLVDRLKTQLFRVCDPNETKVSWVTLDHDNWLPFLKQSRIREDKLAALNLIVLRQQAPHEPLEVSWYPLKDHLVNSVKLIIASYGEGNLCPSLFLDLVCTYRALTCKTAGALSQLFIQDLSFAALLVFSLSLPWQATSHCVRGCHLSPLLASIISILKVQSIEPSGWTYIKPFRSS